MCGNPGKSLSFCLRECAVVVTCSIRKRYCAADEIGDPAIAADFRVAFRLAEISSVVPFSHVKETPDRTWAHGTLPSAKQLVPVRFSSVMTQYAHVRWTMGYVAAHSCCVTSCDVRDSVVPNRDQTPIGLTDELDRTDSTRSAVSIRRDFAALVKIFEHQLKLLSASDEDTRSHILKAKEAAQHGVNLSQQLVERAKTRS
jgi:hypothetical protein